jgi:hypothetical protein
MYKKLKKMYVQQVPHINKQKTKIIGEVKEAKAKQHYFG